MYKLDGRRTFTFEPWMFNPLNVYIFYEQKLQKMLFFLKIIQGFLCKHPPTPSCGVFNHIKSWKIIF